MVIQFMGKIFHGLINKEIVVSCSLNFRRNLYGLCHIKDILEHFAVHTAHHPVQTQEEALLSSATHTEVVLDHSF